MSDGGEESKREGEASRRANTSDYGRTVSELAVAEICEGVGFDCVKQSALEALSNVAIRYICDLGKSATFYTNLAGRSECNFFDIVKGFEDLSSPCGFSGADRCLGASDIVKEMAEFVDTMEEIPFAHSIPRFPVSKCPRGIPSFSQMDETPISKHIPSWLPAFPDPHTYIKTPMWNERKTDPRTDKVEQVRQRRKAERSLLSLQQRLRSNVSALPSGSGHRVVYDAGDGEGLGADREDNPFLALPLPAGEKDVSDVVLPAKLANEEDGNKPASVLETFAPAIDAMKGGVTDSMDLDRKVNSDRRPVVHFKLKAGKKMLVEDLDVNLRKRVNEKKSSWGTRADDKDDKKRRAELILRQSMENPQETDVN